MQLSAAATLRDPALSHTLAIFMFHTMLATNEHFSSKSKSNPITGPEGSRRLSLPDLKTIET